MKSYLEYVGGVITENELKKISKNFKENDIEFKSRDKAGVIYACFDQNAPLALFISKEIIASGIGYDVMKLSVLKILSIISNRKFFYLSSDGAKEKKTSLSLKVELPNEEFLNNTINQAFELFKVSRENKSHSRDHYAELNKEKNEWEVSTQNEYINKIINKQKK